jgi:hypothetical protein
MTEKPIVSAVVDPYGNGQLPYTPDGRLIVVPLPPPGWVLPPAPPEPEPWPLILPPRSQLVRPPAVNDNDNDSGAGPALADMLTEIKERITRIEVGMQPPPPANALTIPDDSLAGAPAHLHKRAKLRWWLRRKPIAKVRATPTKQLMRRYIAAGGAISPDYAEDVIEAYKLNPHREG